MNDKVDHNVWCKCKTINNSHMQTLNAQCTERKSPQFKITATVKNTMHNPSLEMPPVTIIIMKEFAVSAEVE